MIFDRSTTLKKKGFQNIYISSPTVESALHFYGTYITLARFVKLGHAILKCSVLWGHVIRAISSSR